MTSVDTTSHGLSVNVRLNDTATAARPVMCTWKTVGMATLSALISLSKQC